MMAANTSNLLAAFKEQSNLLGLTTVVTVSAATLSPLPLLVGVVAEATYLLFVPDSAWYKGRLESRRMETSRARRELLRARTFDVIDEDTAARFSRLQSIRDQISVQARPEQGWYREVEDKLDYLLEKFLTFAAKEVAYRTYIVGLWTEHRDDAGQIVLTRSKNNKGLKVISPISASDISTGDKIDGIVEDVTARFEREVLALNERLEPDAATAMDESTRAVVMKRIDVLRQRGDGVAKIGRILMNLRVQLALVEDTFGLINDQIRARSPEQVLSDIDGIVYQTDAMTTMLEELATFENLAA